jgi:beta-N-acetylhexosaminidase
MPTFAPRLIFLLHILVFGLPSMLTAATPSPEEMLGQMLMVGFRGDGLEESEDFKAILKVIHSGKAGGVILFNRDLSVDTGKRNIVSPEQIKTMLQRLQTAALTPLFIGIDQEGGRVQRLKPLGGGSWPSPKALGLLPKREVFARAVALGQELTMMGINLNFAPCLDLDLNPANPVIGGLERSFGKKASTVIAKGRAFKNGLNSAGVIAAFKHFPGHGSSGTDSHLGMADITATWCQEELEPYKVLLHEPGSLMVMVGHLLLRGLDDQYPSSLSYNTITGLLRNQMDWQGVVISDDLQMLAISNHYSLEETVRLGIAAGIDILLFGNNISFDRDLPERVYEIMAGLYKSGKISEERIRLSFERIMRLKQFLRLAAE